MPHRIEVFTAGCPLCRETVQTIEVGKCGGCTLIEYDLRHDPTAYAEKLQAYGVRAVPTIVIDGVIKIEGKPDFPFFCSETLYAFLRERYPLQQSGHESSGAAALR